MTSQGQSGNINVTYRGQYVVSMTFPGQSDITMTFQGHSGNINVTYQGQYVVSMTFHGQSDIA